MLLYSQTTSTLFVLVVLLIRLSASEYTCPIKPPASVSPQDEAYGKKPFIDGSKTFIGGSIVPWSGDTETVTSPIIDTSTGERTVIGRLAKMRSADALDVVEGAKKAWNNGRGVWPQMSADQRIEALVNVVNSLKERRDEIINVLVWEICKNTKDATEEFDRTMSFIEATINAFKEMDLKSGGWKTVNGILARVRRAAIGIMMCLGPFNYPFNETYATLIPALLAGNVVIMKIPSIGGLAHIMTMEAYARHLPPGVLNFVSGSGRDTMGPIMASGFIDVLAFIGGSNAADAIIKSHPSPHRLKLFLQLEGKNLGIVLPDADLDVAADQVTIGSTTYNGQRCTAIKLVMVHTSVFKEFSEKLISNFSKLVPGLPWDQGVNITPLPEPKKPKYLQDLIADAIEKGASVINAHQGGGELAGALMTPAIVYPVTENMRY